MLAIMGDHVLTRSGGTKLVALGLVLGALVGAAASGCSDDTTSTPEPGRDAGGDVSPAPAPDSGAPSTNACPATAPIDATQFAWRPPTVPRANACQDDDVEAMRAFLTSQPNATNEEFENFVKNRDVTCHECIFAPESGVTWPPVPMKDGKVYTLNIGACYALVSGSDACGKAVQSSFECEFVACADCTSETELDACRKKARTGACASAATATQSACGPAAASVDAECGSIFDSIRVQCVRADGADAGASDAGTD